MRITKFTGGAVERRGTEEYPADEFTRDTRSASAENPVARDVLAQMVQYAGVNEKVILNPVVKSLKLSAIPRFAGKAIRNADQVIDTMIDLFNLEADTKPLAKSNAHYWWKEAVVYQIYPRSFMDSNGDGIGDLRGIIQKLDYLKELGVDALWLSPIFDSPNDDNGYDVRDYRAIMAEFGTMADAEELIAQLHARGMRIYPRSCGQPHLGRARVVCRFRKPPEARTAKYIWRKPKGKEHPNNWTSFFTGPGLEKADGRDEEYLHLFSKSSRT
jgi:oligo-1,6-glucosidase